MRLRKAKLENFSVFHSEVFDFSPGLNVIIGANASGKSHLMKLLYSVLKSAQDARKTTPQGTESVAAGLNRKLAHVFKPEEDQTGRLVTRKVGRGTAEIRIEHDGGATEFILTTPGNIRLKQSDIPLDGQCIFIPSREVLAMYEGFISAYQDRELSFDETYYDLCVALNRNPLKGRRRNAVQSLIDPLETILGGSVVLEGNRFRVKTAMGNLEAHLLAEGHRKIACLAHLLANGSLLQNSVLFWDEPEANLNPNLVTQMSSMIRRFVANGVQVFLATHDFLLSHEISMAIEFGDTPVIDARFFALQPETQGGGRRTESGRLLSELKTNAILEEFAAHYDREQDRFAASPRASK